MLEQPTLFDAPAGVARRDEAIQRVDDHAEADWKQTAQDAVRYCASAMVTFTTDDVWARIDAAHQADAALVGPHEPRAMGAVMLWAHRQGLVTPLAMWRLSERPECHRRPLRVWRRI